MTNPFLINTLALVTAILLLIFSIFALNQRKSKKLSSVLLSAFLLSNALYIIDFILPTIQNSLNISLSWFSRIGYTFGFLFGPLIYLFTCSITSKNYKLSPKATLHFLLFGIVFIVIISNLNIPWQVRLS